MPARLVPAAVSFISAPRDRHQAPGRGVGASEQGLDRTALEEGEAYVMLSLQEELRRAFLSQLHKRILQLPYLLRDQRNFLLCECVERVCAP